MEDKKEQKLVDSIIEFIETKDMLPWSNGLLNKVINNSQTYGRDNRPYSGLNILLTWMYIELFNWDSDRFLTFNQISKLGYRVKPGEKEHIVVFPVWVWKDEDGKVVPYKYRKFKTTEELHDLNYSSTFVGYECFGVFNLAQTNMPYEPINFAPEKQKTANNDRIEICEQIIDGYLARPQIIFTDYTVTPCYYPSVDEVHIPNIELFSDTASYYGALFHELVHSTGNIERLDRDLKNSFGSSGYAKEELVAHFGSALLMNYAGFEEKDYIANHSAYLKSWCKKIHEPNFVKNLQKTFPKALKAMNFILGNREEGLEATPDNGGENYQ